ncbi:MAG: hypothetical protein LBE11_07785 [Prevotellaceae bacterium]|jgi:chromosomal replication initiator protein|nr:hypothetical protein [Prevotellaceae bacterium]
MHDANINKIIKTVCKLFDTDYETLNTKNRAHEFVLARQTVFYFTKKTTKIPLALVGKIFNRNHATVIHGIRTYENLLATDKHIRETHNRIASTLMRPDDAFVDYDELMEIYNKL